MRALVDRFGLPVRRLALIELFGWSFLLGPVGIDEGETPSARLDLLLGGAKLLQGLGVSPRAAVLSGGRMEDRGRSERVDTSLLEGDQIAARAAEAGINAEHKGILIESCRGDDIVIAPEGISGNLIFRTLMLLCGAQSYGAPVITERMDWIFIDSSRARSGFDGPVMLAGALAGMRGRDAIEYLDCFFDCYLRPATGVLYSSKPLIISVSSSIRAPSTSDSLTLRSIFGTSISPMTILGR